MSWQGRALHFTRRFSVFARRGEIGVHSHPLRHDPSVMSTIYSVMVFLDVVLRSLKLLLDYTPHAASVNYGPRRDLKGFAHSAAAPPAAGSDSVQ